MTSQATGRTSRLKNPKGGLTAAGRAHFKQTEGANLKPGVQGKADTPEKMKRKGSFLRRHFAHPRGPMTDEQGKPTRLALSAHAWGEPVPKDAAGAKRLADKGTRLLERYQATQDKAGAKPGAKPGARKTAGTKRRSRPAAAAKRARASTRKTPARKTAAKRRARK
jgi:hypothetical protein